MSFPERMKSRRIEKRYSQDEVSKIIGVKGNTVWRWENDKANPDTETVIKIAHALDTTAAYLLGEIDNPSPYALITSSTNEQSSGLMALVEKVADENIDLKEPIRIGRKNDMYIIKEGNREFCIPDNEEGRRIFLNIFQSSLKGLGVVSKSPNTAQKVSNGTNSTYLDSVVNNGTQIVAQAEELHEH